MKKTRVGSKAGIKVGKGKPLNRRPSQKAELNGKARGRITGPKSVRTTKSKPDSGAGEEGKIAKREQIIQKKRMMRRNRKKATA